MSTLRRWSSRFNGDGSLWRYLIVGILMSLLDLVLFTTFSVLFGWHEVLSNVISTLVTVCVSFLINRTFVFRAGRPSLRSFFSFAGVTLASGLVLQSFVIWGLVQVASTVVPAAGDAVLLPAAKISAMALGAMANYLGYRWVFKHVR